jgi:hypothetical protein
MVKRGSLFTCKSPERISTRPSLEFSTSEDLSSFYLLLNLRSSLINYDLDKTMRCPAMRKMRKKLADIMTILGSIDIIMGDVDR